MYKLYLDIASKLVKYNTAKYYIRLFFEYAKSRGIIKVNPIDQFADIALPRDILKNNGDDDLKLKSYNADEIEVVLNLMKEKLPSVQYTYFLLLARTGIRKSEALALYKEDVDLDDMILTVNKTLSSDRQGKPIVLEGTKSRNRQSSESHIVLLFWKI